MSFVNNSNRLILDESINVKIFDSSGNSVVANSGALRVSFTFNIKASDSGNILATNGGIRTADYTNDLINGVYISGCPRQTHHKK